MKKLNRKGFTIVELVIVIAVIAILAGLLIPTFTSLIKKANVSADTQTVRNLNTALAAEEILDGGKNTTMYDAVSDIKENGYLLENLTPTSEGNDIVWDSVSDRFLLVDEDSNVVYSDSSTEFSAENAFIVVKSGALSEKYGSYLADGYTTTASADSGVLYASAEENTITATLGLDVGNNTGLSVTYSGTTTATIIIRLNGGSLTIEKSSATVEVYGEANTVTVSAGTVNINATVSTVIVNEATVTINSTVTTLEIENANAKVTASSSATVTTLVTTVTVTEGNINVNPSEEVTSDKETLSLFAGGAGTEKSPYLIETAEQLMKLNDLSSTEGVYVLLKNDITVSYSELKYVTSSGWYWYYCIKSFKGVFNGGGE